VKGNILKWRIKATKISNWIGIGIGLREFLKKSLYTFDNYTQGLHGCYLISNNKYVWTHKNNETNSKSTYGVSFLTGDILSI